jgi:hypothetical protein
MQKGPLTVFANRLISPPNFTGKTLVIESFPEVIRFNLAIHAQSEEGSDLNGQEKSTKKGA